MKTILIYDKNIENLKVMEQKLEYEGYNVKACANVDESLLYVEENNNSISMLITNYSVESFSLNDYVQIIRRLCSDISIVVVSNSSNVSEEIRSLNLNVDEYIRKPILTSAFIKRIERVKNSRYNFISKVFMEKQGVEVDLVNNHVYLHGQRVSVTQKEYQIISYMVRHKNRAISRKELVLEVWGENNNISSLRTVDVTISNIRKNLGLTNLVTVRGIGYKLEVK